MPIHHRHGTTTPAVWLTGLIVLVVATTAILSGNVLPAKAAPGDINGVFAFTNAGSSTATTEPAGATTNYPIPITRTGGTAGAVTVQCTVTGGTGALGVNFSAATSVTFSAGQTTGNCNLPLVDNTIIEGMKTAVLILSISPPVGDATAAATTTTVNIADNDIPTITNAAPNGSFLQLAGTNFTASGTTATFGGSPITVTYLSATSILLSPLPVVPGSIMVTNLAGPSAGFGYVPAAVPTITLVSPNIGSSLGGTFVTITGTSFVAGQTTVTFNGVAGTSVSVAGPTSLTVFTPAGTIGTVEVRATTTGGGTSPENGTFDDYTYSALSATPTVATVSPAAGQPGTTITITGTNFVVGSSLTAVKFSGGFGFLFGTNVIVTSTTSLTVTAPSGTGASQVQVQTANGASTYVAGNDFTFLPASAGPTIASINPATTPVNTTPSVTISGTGFSAVAGQTTVTFGTVAAANVLVSSANQLSVTVPLSASPNRVEVRVIVNSVASPENAGADDFTYTNGSTPTITLISPNTGAAGSQVGITGTNFVAGGTTVTFNGVPAAVTSSTTTTSLTVTVPSGTGTVQVVATTTTGGSSPDAGTLDDFTYGATVAGQPTVTSISPTTCPTGGGSIITINGSNFVATNLTISFGGTVVTSYTWASVGQISVNCPAHNAGAVDITVTANGLTSPANSADLITYTGANPIPVITGVSPSSGGPGTVVTITGTCFTGATSVTFGGAPGTGPSVTGDTSITVTVPTNSSAAGTTVDVLVVSPCGTSGSGTVNGRFTYNGAGAGATVTYQLYFRWTLIAYEGVDGASVASVLKGLEAPVDDPTTNDVSLIVTAIWFWDSPIQDYKGYFTSAAAIPGANQFTTMTKGAAYWIAVTSSASWTTRRGN